LRKPEKEMTAEHPIHFDWEKESLDKAKLRQHFVEEIMHMKAYRQ